GDLSGIGFAVVDELLNGLHRHRVGDDQHVGELHDARDRHGVAEEIERQPLVERGRDRVVGRDEQQGVAVRWRADRGGGRDVAAGLGTIMKLVSSVLLGAALLVSPAGARTVGNAIPSPTIGLGTAAPGGGFPLYGNAFAEVMNAADPSLAIAPRNTKGSNENIPLL